MRERIAEWFLRVPDWVFVVAGAVAIIALVVATDGWRL